MTDWTTPDDVPADTIDRLHRWLLQEGNPADAATPGERAVADIIRAFWPVPATTLAEELRYRADLLDNGDPDGDTPHALRTLATRAEQMEHDLAEARAEAERITGEHDTKAPHNNDCLAGMKDATRYAVNATLTPADIQPGEAWLVQVDKETRTAVKDADDAIPWNTVNPSGVFHAENDDDVTLLTRLAPAPRTITNPDELDKLAEGAVIATATGIARVRQGWYWLPVEGAGPRVISAGVSLPATVLWEPGA